jgi:branched-chain amino acid aminotransferase
MRHDAERMHVPFPFSAEELEAALLSLVEANHAGNATLRVAVIRNRGGLYEGPGIHRAVDLIAFTTDLAAWAPGVKLTYMPDARHGGSPFAGAKITSWAHNLTWYEEAHERGFDEMLLLNEHGEISECTSANIFVIQEARVWTPPLATSGCLPGVTRAILLEEIQLPGISFGERELTPSDLEESEQVFITSSTRDLLPVLEIDHEPLHRSPELLASLQQAFREYRATYIRAHSRRGKTFVA